MSNKEKAKEEIKLLVDKYNRLVEAGRVKSYNEEMTKKDFILPLFRALGWSVEDSEEVTAEEKISKGRVDYAFRIQSIPKLFLEAKSLREDLEKTEFAEQAINYAWHKGATWAILTDFEGIKVFNAEWKSSNPLQNLFFSLNCSQFLDRFEQLWLLSRESLESGVIDTEAEKWGKKAKKVPVDKQLLSDLTRFRELLTKNILKNNAFKNLSAEELDEAIQRIIDRLIFIRTLEDKQLEAPILQSLIREDQTKRVYKKLNNAFRKIDDIYNSKLFAFHLCEELNIDDDVLEKIIIGLFKTADETVHYDFSAIDADVLGNIYEQYLGYLLKKTEKRGKLVEGKAHRKEQGIYYTPTYVVDYIVKNTIGELAKDKKIDLSKIKVLDPACGSGSFLMKAFDYLVTLDRKKNKDSDQMKLDTSGVSVTYGRKIEILKNNIFGVDLDPKAVEIAQLNLLLKAAEKKHRLPTLQENIKVGNSLIDDPAVSPRAFKWEEQFKEIISEGGFDVVVGNPPWGAQITENEKKHYTSSYESIKREIETQLLFIEKALKLTKEHGYIGFIVPNTWMYLFSTEILRHKVLDECEIVSIIELTKYIFADAPDIVPVMVIFKKNKSEQQRRRNIIKTFSFSDRISVNQQDILACKFNKVNQSDILRSHAYIFNPNLTPTVSNLLTKLCKETNKLSNLAKTNYGIKTGDNDKYLAEEKKNKNFQKCLKSKEIGRYSIDWNNLWLNYGTHLAGYRKESLEVPKIIIQYIRKLSMKRRLICAIDQSGEYYPLNNYSYVTGNERTLKYLLAVLNSKLINFYFANTFIDYNIKPTYIDLLPIKVILEPQQQPLIKLVDKMLSLNKRLNELKDKSTDEKAKIEAEIKKTDQEIDELVYKLYGITEAEKKKIEESLN